ncbi:serine/threonine-protein kinase [Tautonia marina]|uniref:serine/threonine-protein kinase n=1 Tax=Tautonia marina TaxID=2653855 RepID=UPI001260495F|nr:serine/threonine-protein kinase [Tautonia marina]
MSEEWTGIDGRSPLGDDLIDERCDRFEAAWMRGDRPRIEDYLTDVPESDRSGLIRELLAVELAYRRRFGESPTSEDYLSRFLDGDSDTLLDLFRNQNGSDLAPDVEDWVSASEPRYANLRWHHRGGLGVVYRAHDRELDRDVALKQIRDHFADRDASRKRFEREARITGMLQHPGIVPVYSLGRDELGRPFYAMRFIEGKSLKEALADEYATAGGNDDPSARLLRLRELLGRFLAACDAIAYAHSRGVIHRDLKPANIMLGPFGETLVVDWGLAKLMNATEDLTAEDATSEMPPIDHAFDETETGEILGTPAYMSPEQASGQPDQIEPATDIYGLGATLYSLLTGRVPVEAASPRDAIEQIGKGAIAGPHSVDPTVPKALDAICRKAMALKVEDRYPSADALAEDLKRWLAGAPVSAYREPIGLRARRWVRRHRTIVTTAAGIALVVVVMGAGVGLWQARQAATQRMRLDRSLLGIRVLFDRARAFPTEMTGWQTALAVARRARSDVSDLPDSDRVRQIRNLADRIESDALEAERVQHLLNTLADVRLAREAEGLSETNDLYARALQRFGADIDTMPWEDIANRLKNHPPEILLEISSFLDDWTTICLRLDSAPDRQERLLKLTRVIDPDPDRNRIRDALKVTPKEDRLTVLRLLADNVGGEDLPVPSALLLAEALVGVDAHDEAAALLRRTVERNPSDLWANFDLAQNLQHHHPRRWDEAIRYYSVARALRPDSAHNLADLLADRGQAAEAIALFQDLIRLRPEEPRHLGCLGRVFKREGRTKESDETLDRAISAYRNALQESPNDANLHNNLGLALHDAGNPNEALAEFHAAMSLNPRHSAASYNLGRALGALGRHAEAIEALHRSLAIDPDNAKAWNHLGMAFEELGRSEAAVNAYRNALKLHPDLMPAHVNLGNAFKTLRRYEEALKSYQTAITIEPNNALIHFNLGNTLFAMKRFEEARKTYEIALSIDPELTHSLIGLGRSLSQLGRIEEALAIYRRALEITPDLAEAHWNMGILLRDQNRFADALGFLETGHRLGSVKPGWRIDSARWVEECRRFLQLDEDLPAILGGDREPNGSWLDVARLCSRKGLHGASARSYRNAFAQTPSLAEDVLLNHRYNASCSALLAASGQGADDPPPNEKDQAELRQWAIDWLRADLAAWSGGLKDNPDAYRSRLRSMLTHWKSDSDLASIRGEEALVSLSPDIQTACRELWEEVDSLLRIATAD